MSVAPEEGAHVPSGLFSQWRFFRERFSSTTTPPPPPLSLSLSLSIMQ